MAPDTDSGTRACKRDLDSDTGSTQSEDRREAGEREEKSSSSLDTGLTVDNCQAPV